MVVSCDIIMGLSCDIMNKVSCDIIIGVSCDIMNKVYCDIIMETTLLELVHFDHHKPSSRWFYLLL